MLEVLDLTLLEVDAATNIVFEEAGKDANIIFGAVIDPSLGDEIRVTVIATGFNQGQHIADSEQTVEQVVIPTQRHTRELQEEINAPVFTRQQEPAAPPTGAAEPLQMEAPKPSFKFDDTNSPIYGEDLDVPAFIRRQQD